MKTEVQAWAKDVLLLDVDSLSDEQKTALEQSYEGRQPAKPAPKAAASPFEAHRLEAMRVSEIKALGDKRIQAMKEASGGALSLSDVDAIERMVQHAIDKSMTVAEFRCELVEATYPASHGPAIHVRHQPDHKIMPKVLEAAVCATGRLADYEKQFDDQTLQLAHDKFKNGIGVKQLWLICAQANGYGSSFGFEVTPEVQNAAFGMMGPSRGRMMQADGFSTISLPNILGAVANKFIREGWEAVDQTPLRIAAIRPVNNFQTITTVSLTGDLQYLKIGGAGEIKHGTVSELTYTNQADTYARMLAITRKDIINDDMGALTAVPRRLGRGAALKLNDIFWTAFLNNSSFFTSGTNSVNTGVADMTVGGLDATETIFMNQTDPDGKPLGIQPAILLVPTALKNKAITLMTSELAAAGATTFATAPGAGNPFRGRFRVESSPYMSNSAYTGYDAAAWYMLAEPSVMPVIEIAALNGRVEPTVETADAEFNTLGVQMRGYSDIGCSLQEYRGGVRADGGSS